MRNSRVRFGLFLAVLAGARLFGQAAPSSPYAGSDACSTCHEDIYNAFQKSPHVRVDKDKWRGFAGRACESCHGPAQKHTETASAEDIKQPAKLAVAAADKICMSCHLTGSTNVARVESSHAKDQVSCVTCHKIHANGPMGLVPQGYAAINKQCSGCHLDVWAQFQKPNHHRVPENAMSCVDCHNPHGSIRPASQQSFRRERPGMPELPRRQARTIRLRARASALRGLRDVP